MQLEDWTVLVTRHREARAPLLKVCGCRVSYHFVWWLHCKVEYLVTLLTFAFLVALELETYGMVTEGSRSQPNVLSW